MNQKFPKSEHLKRKKIIDRLFEQGEKIKAYPLLLVYTESTLPEPDVAIQTGVSVAKRNQKLAVTRNFLKRLMREVYRKNKTDFQTNGRTFAFMFIYIGKEIMSYQELEKAMHKIIIRFNSREDTRAE